LQPVRWNGQREPTSVAGRDPQPFAVAHPDAIPNADAATEPGPHATADRAVRADRIG
jgi:hypothetical protein